MITRKYLYLLLLTLLFPFTTKAQEAYKFEETTYLRWDISEVFVVHEFAVALAKIPNADGLIIVSGKRGKALRYAESVRKWIGYSETYNEKRISIGYGGESKTPKMELWINPKNATQPKFINESDFEYKEMTAFDDYGWLCEPCEYMRRDALERFASELKKYPETRAYISIYPSKRENSAIKTPRQAQKRAVIEKRFLNKLGIENSRIFALVGNYDERSYAALWIMPNNIEPSKPPSKAKNTK